MVPFNVKIGKQSVGITWESLFWFFVVTAGATVVGELIYQKYVTPYLANLPSLPQTTTPTAQPLSALPSNVVRIVPKKQG
jgi:hypothetical protein